ncbi:MAG: hypothetical protein QM756_17395 [Polyangiaceae bacterium]
MLSPQVADAQTTPEPGIEVHGFVSQGFIKTSRNNYLARSERGSFEFSEAGINFTKSLGDDLRVGLQLFARDLGPLGNYTPQLDWFYLDYRPRDWFGLRAGRTKLPFGLYNESSDIDAARVPILLPQSIYPVDHRDYLLAQTGGEAYGEVPLGDAGAAEYRLYGGTINMGPPAAAPTPGISVENLDVPYLVGGRLMWLTPVTGLQVGGSAQALRLDWTYRIAPELQTPLQAAGLLPTDLNGRLPVKFRVNLFVASLEFARDDWLLSAEYSRWTGEFESRAPALLPGHVVNERYYIMGSYRVAPWFTPGIYYSVYHPNVDQRSGRENVQRDLALSFRYDLNAHWLLKLEGHYMHGTAALEESLNDGKKAKDLPENWGALLIKSTAYF